MEEEKAESEEEKLAAKETEEMQKKTLVDPLGIQGDMASNLTLKYDPRYDLSSVKFDAAALLSGVHYATSYDRLRTALESLKSAQGPNQQQQEKGLILGLGMIEGNNFDRFVATSNTVTEFREGLIRAGLGETGQWQEETNQFLTEAEEEIMEVMESVFSRREEIKQLSRVVRFARRYRTVLSLPETLRGLISSPTGYGQAAREYRKAQRVLRGAAGPVFRNVLKELEDVADKWKASLYQVLSNEYLGGSAINEHIVEAVRALRELGSVPDPGIHFANHQNGYALQRLAQGPTVRDARKVLPALRLAYSNLGAGSNEGQGQDVVWGNCLESVCEAIKSVLSSGNVTPEILEEVEQFEGRVGDCVDGTRGGREKQACFVAVNGLVRWVREKLARQITLEGLEEAGSIPGGLRVAVQTTKNLVPVIGEASAVEIGLHCLCKTVDLIVLNCDAAASSTADSTKQCTNLPLCGEESPEGVLLQCVKDTRTLQLDGVAAIRQLGSSSGNVSCTEFVGLCRGAINRAFNGYISRISFRVRAILTSGFKLELEKGFQQKIDKKGSFSRVVYAISDAPHLGPREMTESSNLSDWALEILQFLVAVQHFVDQKLGPDPVGKVLQIVSELIFFVIEDLIEAEKSSISKHLAARFAYSIKFVAVVLKFARCAEHMSTCIITRQLQRKVPTIKKENRVKLLSMMFIPNSGGSSNSNSSGSSLSVSTSSAAAEASAMRSSAPSASKQRVAVKEEKVVIPVSEKPTPEVAPKASVAPEPTKSSVRRQRRGSVVINGSDSGKDTFAKPLDKPKRRGSVVINSSDDEGSHGGVVGASPDVRKKSDPLGKLHLRRNSESNPFGKKSESRHARKKSESMNPFASNKKEEEKAAPPRSSSSSSHSRKKSESANPFGSKKEEEVEKKTEPTNPFALAPEAKKEEDDAKKFDNNPFAQFL
jgi:hypothetical protein